MSKEKGCQPGTLRATGQGADWSHGRPIMTLPGPEKSRAKRFRRLFLLRPGMSDHPDIANRQGREAVPLPSYMNVPISSRTTAHLIGTTKTVNY